MLCVGGDGEGEFEESARPDAAWGYRKVPRLLLL